MSTPIVLTDVAAGVYRETFELVPKPEGPALHDADGNERDDWSIRKHRMFGGLSDGVDVVTVNNGSLAMSILPTRGMGLWKGHYEGIHLGWDSPVTQPVNPMFVNLEERGGLGWLSGFNELLCRCGLAFNGPPALDEPTGWPTTLHGKIANQPAHTVACQIDEDDNRLKVLGVVDEAMMFGGFLQLTSMIETEVGSNAITIRDRITNRTASVAELELLYHTNLGRDVLQEGSQLVAAIDRLCPRDPRASEGIDTWDTYLGPTEGYTEEAFFMTLRSDTAGETVVLLKSADGEEGVSLRFRVDELPCFSLWKNTQPEAEGYVTGLEPGINWPNVKAFEREQGRVRSLQPDESYETSLTLAVHDGADAVAEVEREIQSLGDESEPEIHPVPVLPFAPEPRS